MAEPAQPARRVRADSLRNRERVLSAAREAFAAAGPGVPLDEIAARAGVGPGTVYRHFPSKEALFAAVAEQRVRDLVDDARARREAPDPGAALDGFLARLAEEAEHKRDLSEVMTLPSPVRAELHDALDALLTRARDAGAVRADISTADLLALLKGLLAAVHASPEPGRRTRLLDVVRNGLRVP
jgi:AcrR family transcriptional regulator